MHKTNCMQSIENISIWEVFSSICPYGRGWRREIDLSPPVKYFTDRSKAVLLLWIIYVISVLFCYAFMHVCLLMPCGHLLGKG